MSKEFLYPHQKEVLPRIKNGCILNGAVGSGKSRTILYYYFTLYGGVITDKKYFPAKNLPKIYVITTARKRDLLEWEKEFIPFLITDYKIDSWNNIKKYIDVTDSIFIFDEDRVVGYGAWVKAFLKIVKNNKWTILSATPGDKPEDYIAVFIANGFVRNKSDFQWQYIVYKRSVTYPLVDYYINMDRFDKLRKDILIEMNYKSSKSFNEIVKYFDYDGHAYKMVTNLRVDSVTGEYLETSGAYCYALRKACSPMDEKCYNVLKIFEENSTKHLIIFYNYNYELDFIKKFLQERSNLNYKNILEFNGHKHDDFPDDPNEPWILLVQYSAGSEGWNCTTSDTIIFFSMSYSYKQMKQAKGRIDRLNSKFETLNYYIFRTKSPIDNSIADCLSRKKDFNERLFADDKY